MTFYAAISDRAVCGIVVEHGMVVEVAPYLRRRIIGKRFDVAMEILNRDGFRVVKIKEES